MGSGSHDRGWPIYHDGQRWRYTIGTGLTPGGMGRPCVACGRKPGDGGLDPCLMPLIAALNGAGLKTVASCCGHGHRHGNVMLEDGREILIARNWTEARAMESAIDVDINGATKLKGNTRWRMSSGGSPTGSLRLVPTGLPV